MKHLLFFLVAAIAGMLPAVALAETREVASGETLAEIAAEYGLDVAELAQINGIDDIDRLEAGVVLTIPVTPTGYTVAPGDTLNEIADLFGIPPELLLDKNELDDPDRLLAGTQLIVLLPGTEDALPPEMRDSTRIAPHIVQAGESLSKLAARYGITVETLAHRNGIADPDYIQAGQAILIGRPAFTHTIGRGDTLSEIAATYATSIETLIGENGILNPERIMAGASLIIPTEIPVARDDLGESRLGRVIPALTIGSGEDRIVLVGGLHAGPEQESADIVQELFNHFGQALQDLPAGVEVVFIPVANPDGYAAGSRLNALGVDLNRNWPSDNWTTMAVHGDTPVSGGRAPLSEPEVAALYAFLLEHAPDIVLSYHGYAALIEGNDTGNANELASAYAEASGYEAIEDWDFYPLTGQLIDALAEKGLSAADVELEAGDANAFERNLGGLLAVAEALSAD